MSRVRRVGSPKLGEHKGHTSLEQRFLFPGQTYERLAKALWTRPLVGPGGLFGTKGREGQDTPKGRLVRDFSPAPTVRYDIRIRRETESLFTVNFSQPDREVPYLDGDAVWMLYEDPTGDGALLVEHINDRQALEWRAAPLTGKKASLRRWCFFRFGHAQVMDEVTANLARLAF